MFRGSPSADKGRPAEIKRMIDEEVAKLKPEPAAVEVLAVELSVSELQHKLQQKGGLLDVLQAVYLELNSDAFEKSYTQVESLVESLRRQAIRISDNSVKQFDDAVRDQIERLKADRALHMGMPSRITTTGSTTRRTRKALSSFTAPESLADTLPAATRSVTRRTAVDQDLQDDARRTTTVQERGGSFLTVRRRAQQEARKLPPVEKLPISQEAQHLVTAIDTLFEQWFTLQGSSIVDYERFGRSPGGTGAVLYEKFKALWQDATTARGRIAYIPVLVRQVETLLPGIGSRLVRPDDTGQVLRIRDVEEEIRTKMEILIKEMRELRGIVGKRAAA